jgi:hypothetical protein
MKLIVQIKIFTYTFEGLSEEMASSGYKDIISIDISQLVITYMSEKYKGNPALSCMCSIVISLTDVCREDNERV